MRWSEISNFNSCPFKHHLHQSGWKKREDSEETTDLRFGQSIHSALESHYKGSSLEETLKVFTDSYQEHTDKKEKSVESGVECLKSYVEHYKDQDKDWRVIATELADSVETLTGNHDLHIDLVAEHKPSGSIYFWDHKTTSKNFSPMYWKKFEIDSQMSRYTKYVQDKFGSCAGALINGISVGYRSRKYMGEPAGYWQKFERQIFNRSQALIDMWLESDKQWEELIKISSEKNLHPKALGSICAYCEFYPYCMSGCDKEVLDCLYEQKLGG